MTTGRWIAELYGVPDLVLSSTHAYSFEMQATPSRTPRHGYLQLLRPERQTLNSLPYNLDASSQGAVASGLALQINRRKVDQLGGPHLRPSLILTASKGLRDL